MPFAKSRERIELKNISKNKNIFKGEIETDFGRSNSC